MATTTERVRAVEERTDNLETALARFIAQVERMESEGARQREEAARQREEAARQREEAARDRQAIREEAEARAERDREQAEARAERHREESERRFQAMRQDINRCRGEVANKLGTVVEDFVAPSIRRLARDVLGCGDQEWFGFRTYRYRDNDRAREREFDALYVGTRAVLLNDTKTTARPEYCREFVEFLKDDEFVRYFPELSGKPIVPVFSSLSIPDNVTTYLTGHGVYALAMGDEAMQVLNLEAVRNRPAR